MSHPEVMTPSPAFPLGWSSQRLEGHDTVVVAVAGELDRFTSPPLRDHLAWQLSVGCTRLVLDTADVTFADAGAHDLLAALGHLALSRGCTIVVVAPGLALGRVLGLLGPPVGVELQPVVVDPSPEVGLSGPR